MAKHRKKTKKRNYNRRRRVGAIKDFDVQSTALKIGGAILASKAQQMLSRDPTKATMVAVAPYIGLGLGIALPMFVKNRVIKDLAEGMAVQGGVSVLKKLAPGIVGNFAMIPVVSGGTTNRFRNIPKPSINGVGYALPKTSVYKDSMSVVSGIGCADGSGSGAAY